MLDKYFVYSSYRLVYVYIYDYIYLPYFFVLVFQDYLCRPDMYVVYVCYTEWSYVVYVRYTGWSACKQEMETFMFITDKIYCTDPDGRGLRYRPAEARLLGLRLRIPLGAWMFVACECCFLSGRGICDGADP